MGCENQVDLVKRSSVQNPRDLRMQTETTMSASDISLNDPHTKQVMTSARMKQASKHLE